MMTMLPPLALPVGQMSKKDLVSFIPQMLRSATGRVRPPYGKQDQKPIWWPKEVPWSNPRVDRRNGKQTLEWEEALRRVIYSCYSHHGLEYMLAGELHQGSPATSGDVPPPLKRTTRSVNFTDADDPKREVDLPVGIPNAGGVSPMHTPQDLCASPTLAGTVPTSGLPQANSPTEQGKTGSAEKHYLEVYICFFCQVECINRAVLYQHQQQCALRMAPGCQTPPATPRTPAKHSKEKARFLDNFELVPLNKLQSLRQKKKRDLDCQIIDLKNDPMPKTPTTPRSQKSLMSQLSRDVTVERRPREDGADNASVKSDESEEEVKLAKASSLLYIDLTSLLGQRIKKHVGSDFKVLVEKDSDDDDSDTEGGYEAYCRTPKKGHSQGRLRSRPNPFPVTYKRKRTWGPHSHKYKFNSKDKEEFRIQLKTGLDACSRYLKSTMKPCKVVMRKLTPSQIQRLSKGPRTPVTSKDMGLRGPLSAWLRHTANNPELLKRLQEQLSQLSGSEQRLLLFSPQKKGFNAALAATVLSPSAFYANMAVTNGKGSPSAASLLTLNMPRAANGVPSAEGKKSKSSPKEGNKTKDKGKKQSDKAKSKKDNGGDKKEKDKSSKDKPGKDKPAQKKASKDKLLKEKIAEKKANKEKLVKSKQAQKQSEKNKNSKGKSGKENDSKKESNKDKESVKEESKEMGKVESKEKKEPPKENVKEKKEINQDNEKGKESSKENVKDKQKETKKPEKDLKKESSPSGKKEKMAKDKDGKKEASKVTKGEGKDKTVKTPEGKLSKQDSKKEVGSEKAKDSKKDSGNEKTKDSKKDSGSEKAKDSKKDSGNEKTKHSKKDSGNEKTKDSKKDIESEKTKDSKKEVSNEKTKKESPSPKDEKKKVNDKGGKAESGKVKGKEKEKKAASEKKGSPKAAKNKPNQGKKTKDSGKQKGGKEIADSPVGKKKGNKDNKERPVSKAKGGKNSKDNSSVQEKVAAGKENVCSKKDNANRDSKTVKETSSKCLEASTVSSKDAGRKCPVECGQKEVVCKQEQNNNSPQMECGNEPRGKAASNNSNASQDKSSKLKVAKDNTCTPGAAETRESRPVAAAASDEGGLRRSRRRGSVDSIDSLSSKGSLPRSVRELRKPDCDVISISSSEEEELDTGGSPKRPRRGSTDSRSSQPSKRARHSSPAPDADGELSSQAVLFKCHLCYAEIMFNLATTDFIRNHFADKHNVPNIQILEHRDQNNQLVLSIVEDTPAPLADSKQARRATRKRGDDESSTTSDVICIDD